MASTSIQRWYSRLCEGGHNTGYGSRLCSATNVIRYEVINQYRAANGRLYEEDDARQEAERNFRDLKKDKLYERALQEALAYYRISEKDFLVLSYSVSYDALNYWAEESLYKTENRQADADDNALSHEFDLFVDQLVEQAEIKYF